ncbi:flagellar hook-associated protein FlgK [Ruminococcaceae bacterium OttesenSCG-928-I18]|nr:flagellar hook-associated protein FlgK [Ruminococcaceae bacterium OttesenSCG-928-I18]
MRPTFMGFETATRGLMVNQKALDIVGNNLTNVSTMGYTRQRVDLVSLNVNMRYTRYNQNSTPYAGQGSAVYGVSQVRDAFLDKRFREEYSDVGYYDTVSSVLTDLHAAIDEIAPATMTTAMYDFEAAWNELLQKANETTNSANILAKATQIVSVFQQMSQKIDNVWNQQEYNLKNDVNQVNSILQRIALLNDEISREKFNCMEVNNKNYQPLELLDKRNVLLDELSKFGDVTFREEEDGMVTVFMGGHKAVDGKEYETMSYAVDRYDPNYPSVNVIWDSTGKDITFSSGTIKGYLDMMNGRGIHSVSSTNVNFSQGIHYYKEKIDMFANTFADAFNRAIAIDNTNPVEYKTLFTFKDDTISAANIRVNEEWVKDATYITTEVRDKIEKGGDDNSYAAKAYQIFKTGLDFGEFKGTINEYIEFYSTTKLSNDTAYNQSRLDAVGSISSDILNQIQEISGVSMEEEGVDMLMYKKAYDAVSRVFTTLDEMLDKLINGTGVVGR